MVLGKIIQAVQDERRRDHLVRYLKGALPVVNEIQPMVPGQPVRASSVSGLCPRLEVICYLEGIVRKQRLTAEQMWWFGVGTAYHEMLQAWLTDVGVLKDAEKELLDEDILLSGHIDGILSLPDKPVAVVDFKTAAAWMYHAFSVTPDAGHVQQLQAYMWLTGLPDGVLLYINKQAERFEGAFVEHWQRFNEQSFEVTKRKLHHLQEGLARGVPPEGLCFSRDEGRARRCPARKSCFGRSHGT